MIDVNQLNGLSLAYIGDSVYELIIRKYLISNGLMNVNKLHKKTTSFTSGVSQADLMQYLINNNILTDDELAIYKRGRNAHVHTTRKNIDHQIYMMATGFEALIGYLYLTNQHDRIDELVNIDFNRKEIL